MNPGAANFVVYAGATFLQIVEWQAPDTTLVDLNGYVGLMQVRSKTGTLLTELSTAAGSIVAQVDKRVRLMIDDNATRVLAPGDYFYDLLFRSNANGVVVPLLKGRFTVKALNTNREPGTTA